MIRPAHQDEFVQGLDGGRWCASKVWTIALLLVTCMLPPVSARGAGPPEGGGEIEKSDTSDRSDRSDGSDGSKGAAALAVWIGAGEGVGPADAVHLAAAWQRAGGVNVAVLTGHTVRAEAVVAAVLRMRARLQTGDVVLVGYSGPMAAPAESSRGWRWSGIEGEKDALAMPAAAWKGLDSSGAVLVMIQIVAGRGRSGIARTAAATLPDGIPMIWTAGTSDRPAESWAGRTRAADALVRELERARERGWEGTIEAWLRNAARRCSLETAGRTLCDVAVGEVREPAGWPMRGRLRSSLEPVGALGEALERVAALLESLPMEQPTGDDSPWEAARVAAREAALPRLAEWIGELSVGLHPDSISAAQHDEAYEAAAMAWRAGRGDDAERKLDLHLRQPDAPAALRALMAELRWARGDITGAVALARAALAPVAEGVVGGANDPRAVFHASRVLALFAERVNDVVEAERRFRAAAEAGADDRVRDPRALAEARCGLARALRQQGGAEAAVAEAEAALAAARDVPAARPEVPLILWELGEAHAAAGRVGDAIAAWREASDQWAELRGAAPPLSVVLRLAGTLLETGETDEAIRRLHSAVNATEAASAPVVERVAAHRLLSLAWNRRGERVAALRHAQEAWREAASAPEMNSADLAMLQADLAALYFAAGDAARAEEFAERSVAEWGRAAYTNRESLAAAWVLLGEARMRLNRHVDAAAAWSNAAVMVAELGVGHRPQWIRARTQETRAWVEAGQVATALEASDAVAGLLVSFAEGVPPRLQAEAWLQRARALEASGKAEEADAAYERALAVLDGAGGQATDPVLRAEIAVRCALLRVTRGRLFGAQRMLAAAGDLPEGLSRELVSAARRLRAQLQDAMKPHAPITTVADIMSIQALELDYRARRSRDSSTLDPARGAEGVGL